MRKFNYSNYTPAQAENWTGRIDGIDEAHRRWHQVVQIIDLQDSVNVDKSVVFLGFCCDEGVRRNQGRVGARKSPYVFRQILSNLPIHFSTDLRIKDAGNIQCDDGDLEQAQYVLSEAVAKIIENGGFPVVLGGGHEVTYGHYKGLEKAVQGQRIGIINLDAHLDCRPLVDAKGNSGTSFYQIYQECAVAKTPFFYLALGIQQISNTQSLFDYAEVNGTQIVYADQFNQDEVSLIKEKIDVLSKEVDHIYLTIDLDVFAAPYAPGVSALAFNGIIPDRTFFEVFKHILSIPNLTTIDIAELNPKFDIDQRTTKLGSSLLFEFMNSFG